MTIVHEGGTLFVSAHHASEYVTGLEAKPGLSSGSDLRSQSSPWHRGKNTIYFIQYAPGVKLQQTSCQFTAQISQVRSENGLLVHAAFRTQQRVGSNGKPWEPSKASSSLQWPQTSLTKLNALVLWQFVQAPEHAFNLDIWWCTGGSVGSRRFVRNSDKLTIFNASVVVWLCELDLFITLSDADTYTVISNQ